MCVAYFPPLCVTSLKCTLTPLITLSLHPSQKMIRAAFYLGNREGSCQTAHCCPDCCTLCPYFIFPLKPVSWQVPTAMVPSGPLACDSGPFSWTFKDETLSLCAQTSFSRGLSKDDSWVKAFIWSHCCTDMSSKASFMSEWWGLLLISPHILIHMPACWPPHYLISWGQWSKPLTHVLM